MAARSNLASSWGYDTFVLKTIRDHIAAIERERERGGEPKWTQDWQLRGTAELLEQHIESSERPVMLPQAVYETYITMMDHYEGLDRDMRMLLSYYDHVAALQTSITQAQAQWSAHHP